jgi:hypothetical protein
MPRRHVVFTIEARNSEEDRRTAVVRVEGDVLAVGVGDAEGRHKVVVALPLRVVPVRERVDVDLALDVRPPGPVQCRRVPFRTARHPPRNLLVPEPNVRRKVLERVGGDLSLCGSGSAVASAAFGGHYSLVDAGVPFWDVDLLVLVRHRLLLLLDLGHDGVRSLLLRVLLPDPLDRVVRHQVPRRQVLLRRHSASAAALPGPVLPDRDALHHEDREEAEAPEAKDRRAEQDEEPIAVPQRGQDALAAAAAAAKLGLEPPRWRCGHHYGPLTGDDKSASGLAGFVKGVTEASGMGDGRRATCQSSGRPSTATCSEGAPSSY